MRSKMMEAPGEVGRSGAPGEVGGSCPVVGRAPGEVGRSKGGSCPVSGRGGGRGGNVLRLE